MTKGCSFKGTEPSPKGLSYCAHLTPIGTQMIGKDGNNWIVKTDKNGRHFWSPAAGAGKVTKTKSPKSPTKKRITKAKSPAKKRATKKAKSPIRGFKFSEKEKIIYLSPQIHRAAWTKIKNFVKQTAFDLE